jgi:hypothetical protein
MKRSLVVIAVALVALSPAASAKEFANVEYLCADWGPAMKLPSKPGEKSQFSDADEEIYFLKQVTRFTRRTLLVPDLFSGAKTRDIGRGVSIYLCKMRSDGSAKTEIRELSKNPNYPIDTQDQSTWMDVNTKLHKIALAIKYAGSDLTGLWTMNLDGTELKRIITPAQVGDRYQGINHPSWTPDGKLIVYEEELRGGQPYPFNISICDSNGREQRRLLEAPAKGQYRDPSVSPDGTLIAFAKFPDWYAGQRWIWLADIDGSHVRPLGGTQSRSTWGNYPTWSPDGKRIAVWGSILDASNGKTLLEHEPQCQGKQYTYGWAHWGKSGFVGYTVAGILVTDSELKEAKLIGASNMVECSSGRDSCRW